MANIRSNRKSGFILRSGVMRRETLWLSVDATRTIVTAVGGTLVTSYGAGALALRPFTIVRTRLLIFVQSDQAAAVEATFGAYGQAVVSDQVSAIGITAVPTPVTDLASDLWYVH